MSKEAMKLALELFEQFGRDSRLKYEHQAIYKTIVALKEALKQEQGEPVAYWNFNSGLSHCMIDQLNEAAKHNPAPLYTTPQQRTWVGLTDEQAMDAYCETPPFGTYKEAFVAGIRFIEAKLKEKNNA
jgi:hypothetical protein